MAFHEVLGRTTGNLFSEKREDSAFNPLTTELIYSSTPLVIFCTKVKLPTVLLTLSTFQSTTCCSLSNSINQSLPLCRCSLLFSFMAKGTCTFHHIRLSFPSEKKSITTPVHTTYLTNLFVFKASCNQYFS